MACTFPYRLACYRSLASSCPKSRCEITIISFSRSICHGGLAALTGVTGNLIPTVFHAIVTLSAPFGHLPLEGKAVKLRKSLAT